MTDLDTILSQLMQELHDFSMWLREYSLWVFLGIPAAIFLAVMLQRLWERHKERQQAYHPACPESAFAPLGIGFTPSSTVRRDTSRRRMMGVHAVRTFLTGRTDRD